MKIYETDNNDVVKCSLKIKANRLVLLFYPGLEPAIQKNLMSWIGRVTLMVKTIPAEKNFVKHQTWEHSLKKSCDEILRKRDQDNKD